MIKRGDIYLVDLTDAFGSEQSGVRPAIIMQNNIGNKYSPTTLIVPLTSKKKNLTPTHVTITPDCGVARESEAECEQARVADKRRLKRQIGVINNPDVLKEINQKIMVAFGISSGGE